MSCISHPVQNVCPLTHLTENHYADIECQFFLGTEAYSAKLYGVAAAHWQYVIDTEIVYDGDDKFKAKALGTVNFLRYYGLGVKQDRRKAVEGWKLSVKGGGLEARKHIGVAYSDINFEKRDLVKALAWYQSIFILHPHPEELDGNGPNIYKEAASKAILLRDKLSKAEQVEALKYAKLLINQ